MMTILISLIFISIINIERINATIHLNRSSLSQLCNCDINSDFINLQRKNISSIDPSTFKGLANLKNLNLANNNLSSLDATVFEGLSNLKRLDLSGNFFSSIGGYTFQGIKPSYLNFFIFKIFKILRS